MNRLEVLDFMHAHENWEELLKEKPYCLNIKRDGDYILMLYDLIDSNFNECIVNECSGIIFKEYKTESGNKYKVVCFPFTKFFNYTESHAQNTLKKMNLNSLRFYEKIDGIFIKIWKDEDTGKVIISSNESIYASNTSLMKENNDGVTNLCHIVNIALGHENIKLDVSIEEFMNDYSNFTFMFELTSPYSRVTVDQDHKETKLTLVGVRNNYTWEEVDIKPFERFFEIPKIYEFNSIDEASDFTSKLGVGQEGFVICDDKFNRIKIKSIKR